MLWINKIYTYYIYISSKANKQLHWYVSVTGLAERARLWRELGGCGGVGETRVLQSSTCSLQQMTAAALPSSCFSAESTFPRSGRSSFGSQRMEVAPKAANLSNLKILLLTAKEARDPIFFLQSPLGQRSKPCSSADSWEPVAISELSCCRE